MVKENFIKKLVAIILVFCLTATDFIFATAGVVLALSARTELENGNLIFEAYFKDGEKQATQKTANISEGENLFLSLNLKAGKLQNGKIKINNSNFSIVGEQVNSKFVKSVNTQTNEIQLNEINYNDGAIEIKVPVKFEEADKIDLDYFERDVKIRLFGKYVNNEEGKEIETEEIMLKLNWTEKDVEVNYNANIEKVINFENKTIVQVGINSTHANKYLPKETEKLTVIAPVINGITPKSVVLVDGIKINGQEDVKKDEETIKTTYTNNLKNGNKINWNKQGNEYKIIYTYEELSEIEQAISIEVIAETSLYNNVTTTNKNENGKGTTISSNKTQGELVGLKAKSTTEETYKGYMYANSNETTYNEKYSVEISSLDAKNIAFELKEDNFTTEKNELISTNNQTEYKQIKINSKKLLNVLGKNGQLIIKARNNEIKINNETTNSDKEIIVNYDQIKGTHNVVMQVIDAENEGLIEFEVQKAIKGSAGYDKETLKTINAIETTVKVSAQLEKEEITATALTKLKETTTSATLTMNNDNVLSTTNENNVEFVATLKTGTMDTDLLKSPAIIITLPEEVTDTQISSVSALYAEEALKIAGQKVSDDKRKIVVKLDGEQINYNNKFIEGIKITVNAKIELNEMAVSRKAKVNMVYTNENNSGKPFETNIDVSINAPAGLITKSALDAQFETKSKGLEKLAVTFINNCGNTIKNLSLIGTMPKVEMTKKEFEESVKNNFKATINDVNLEIQYSDNSEDWNNDYENSKFYKIITANTKFEVGEGMGFGIQFETSKIIDDFKFEYTVEDTKRKEKVKIDNITTNYDEIKDTQDNIEEIEEQEEITENIVEQDEQNEVPKEEQEQSEENTTKENKEEKATSEKTKTENKKSTDKEQNVEKTQSKPLTIKLVAQSGEGQVKDGDEVFEGQIIRYTYLVKNNTTKEIKNVMLNAIHENANVFKDTSTKQEISSKPDEMATYTHELETTDNSAKCYLGTLNAGETKQVTYQIRVKENIQTIENKVTATGDGIEEQNLLTYNFVKNGELKLTISNNEAKENVLTSGKIFGNKLSLTNTTDKDLENVKLEFIIPKEFEYYETEKYNEEIEYTVTQEKDNYVKINVKKIPAGETKSLYVAIKVVNEDEEITKKIQYSASINGNTYYSNELSVNLDKVRYSQIQASMAANITGTVRTGDNLIYTISIKNMGAEETNITINDYVPDAAAIKKVYYIQNNKENIVKDIFGNYFTQIIKIAPYEELDVVIETQVDEKLTPDEELINYAEIQDSYASDFLTTNRVNNTLEFQKEPEENIEIGTENVEEQEIYEEEAYIESEEAQNEEEAYIEKEETQNQEKANIENEEIQNQEETYLESEDTHNKEKVYIVNEEGISEEETYIESEETQYKEKYNISGVVWKDANKNGTRDDIEKAIPGVKVEIGNIETGNYVTDNEGNRMQSVTNENGEYNFEVINGKYIVIFTYDNTEYRNSEYRVLSASEENNSDVITSKLSKTNDEIKYAITDTLVVDGQGLENIDAGFIKNEIFDLNLNQYIAKVTVQNEEGTKEYELNKTQLANLEIYNKDLEGSNVLVEYKLEVKNDGEIAGYANEVVDYLPKDMTFNSSLNKNWYLSNDGYLHNTELANEIIAPGESKEISIILTKKLTENNLGLTSNKAEIKETSNDLAILDKDNGDSNTSTSEIIISNDKGIVIIITVIICIIALITTGVVIYVKKRKE